MNRLVIAAAGIVVAVVLFLVFRPDGGDDSTSSPPPPNPTTTPTSETATRSVPPPPAIVQIPIVVQGGKPVGGIKRATVAKDRVVVLVVRSDVADEVHLHGYNVMRDLEPGTPARLRFRATIPGQFEAELEQRGLQIANITVR
ncbi:MAG TPA: hypothetical protein VKA45_01975 [Gaiellaceae bacterium]|nr:hypothetical protein [Gaiellaceae bacterium]